MHYKINSYKGITLVALVITVIVLLILAGVAISAIIGEDGIFNKVKYSSEKYNNAMENEATEINALINKIDDNFKEEAKKIILSSEDGSKKQVLISEVILDIIENPKTSSYIGREIEYSPISVNNIYLPDNLSTAEVDESKILDPNVTISEDIVTVKSGTVYANNQTITRNSVEWVIYDVEDGKLRIVPKQSSVSATNTVYLEGVAGYNNGVLALNQIANGLFSNEEIGATAQNLAIEDIERHFNQATRDSVIGAINYTGLGAGTTGGSMLYGEPIIYLQERAYKGSTGLGYSEQSMYYSGITGATRNAIFTQYTKNHGDNLYDLAMYNNVLKPINTYWLASRCNSIYTGDRLYFSIRTVTSTAFSADTQTDVTGKYGYSNCNAYAIFPIVSIVSDMK